MKNTFFKYMGIIEETFASFFFISGSIISLYGVFMRYVMKNPVTWTTEIFEMLMVFAIFIGFGMALKDNQHIAVDIVYEKLPALAKKIVNVIANVLGFGFAGFLTIMGMEMVSVAKEQGSITIDVGIPVWLTYLAMPIGMGLLAFYFLVRLVNVFRTWKEPEKVEEQNIEELF